MSGRRPCYSKGELISGWSMRRIYLSPAFWESGCMVEGLVRLCRQIEMGSLAGPVPGHRGDAPHEIEDVLRLARSSEGTLSVILIDSALEKPRLRRK